jgi:hypothetical protein
MMKKKWVPHILTAISLVAFIVLGLASDVESLPPPPPPTNGGDTPVRPPALREVRRDFTTPGQHSFVFSEGFPATVHVYMVGAGGGGQGGHSKDYVQGLGTRTERGTGASGGGGAVLYTSFEITSPATFNIVVGTGGTGGARHHKGVGGSWEAGRAGAAGGDTTLRFGSLNLTAQGGRGGGGSGNQNVTGGAGGTQAQAPSGQPLLSWAASGGGSGTNGGHNTDLRSTASPGRPGQILPGNGPITFGGVGAGSGALGGFNQDAGSVGTPGRVLLIITYTP